jgi:hypothetical protein
MKQVSNSEDQILESQSGGNKAKSGSNVAESGSNVAESGSNVAESGSNVAESGGNEADNKLKKFFNNILEGIDKGIKKIPIIGTIYQITIVLVQMFIEMLKGIRNFLGINSSKGGNSKNSTDLDNNNETQTQPELKRSDAEPNTKTNTEQLSDSQLKIIRNFLGINSSKGGNSKNSTDIVKFSHEDITNAADNNETQTQPDLQKSTEQLSDSQAINPLTSIKPTDFLRLAYRSSRTTNSSR